MSDQYQNKIHAFASADSSPKGEEKVDPVRHPDKPAPSSAQTAKRAFTENRMTNKTVVGTGDDREDVSDLAMKKKKMESSISDFFGEGESKPDKKTKRASEVTSQKEKSIRDEYSSPTGCTLPDLPEEEFEASTYETVEKNAKLHTPRVKEVSPSSSESVTVRRAPQGYGGIVRNVEHYSPTMVPGKLSRWMRSFFMGVPYSPNDAAVSFYVVSDDMSSVREWHVEAAGNVMGLANGLRVEVVGRPNGNGVIEARRIYHVTGDDPAMWPVLTDNRQRSAASVRLLTLLILFIAVNLVFAILSILIPAFRFLEAEWPTFVVYAIFIAFGINWVRRQFRRFR